MALYGDSCGRLLEWHPLPQERQNIENPQVFNVQYIPCKSRMKRLPV